MQLSATAIQDVPTNTNVIFDNPTCCSNNSNVIYQSGSGIAMLRGSRNQCRAKYVIEFNGNVATPTGGTVGQISFAITLNGAPLFNAVGMAYPAAVEQYDNISMKVEVDVPCGCCYSIAVKNIGENESAMSNANLLINRKC